MMKILITGALSGLGYQYAKKLAARGHIVYAGVETKEQKLSLEEKIKEERIILFPILINLLDLNTCKKIETLELDVLILQAGIGEGGSILEIDMNRVEDNYHVNVLGNLQLIQLFLRSLVEHKRSGKILITSSLAAFLPFPYLSSYTSTKISLYLIAKTLRMELKFQNIPVKVHVILPGVYSTGFNEVMVDNKMFDHLILREKAHQMTKYQKLFFSLSEKKEFDSLSNKIVRAVETNYSRFSISAPFSQKVAVKLYILLTSFLEL